MTDILQSIFDALNLNTVANSGDVWGVLGALFLLVSALPFLTAKKPHPALERKEEPKTQELPKEEILEPKVEEPVVEKVVTVSWKQRLMNGLERSRSEVWGKMTKLIHGKIDEDKIEEIEELLYGADVGPSTVNELLGEIEKNFLGKEADEKVFKEFLYNFLKSKMSTTQDKVDHSLYEFTPGEDRPKVIMVVGVNGAGKTTTIGKLATKLTKQGVKGPERKWFELKREVIQVE